MPPESPAVAKGALWTGRVISTLIVLFLVFDSVLKFVKPAPVIDTFAHLGISIHFGYPIRITLLYALSLTSILGAILLTGYLGGSVRTGLRVGDPLFSHVLFPTFLGALLWLGLCV